MIKYLSLFALLTGLSLGQAPTFRPAGINGEGVVQSPFITALGGTTAGKALFQMANPGAVRYLRFNADNSVSQLDAASFLTAIGGGGGASLNASNLTSGTVPFARLVNTQIVGNVSVTINPLVRDVILNVALSQPRNYTLPLANTYPAGTRLTFTDMAGGISNFNTATLVTGIASDTINGNFQLVLRTPNASPILISDGISKWNADIRGLSRGGTGAIDAPGARFNLGLSPSDSVTFNSVAAPSGFVGNINGSAGTVTNIGNLTGVVTSVNRSTSIANNALAIATTSGLQAALDARMTIPTPASSSVARTELTPVTMTWDRVATTRPFEVIDIKHLHLVSAWENGLVGNYYSPNDRISRYPNPAITVVSGKAVITTGSGLLKVVPSNIHPPAPWASCEATLNAAPTAGTGGVGPAFIRDIDRHIWFRYDVASGQLQLTERSSSTVTRTAVVAHTPTYPLKLTVKICGGTITGWVGDQIVLILTSATVSIDYRSPAIWSQYFYGLVGNNATQVVSKLRGGPPGALGAENIQPVTYADGSPYFVGNRLLCTADCHGVGGVEDWFTCLWLVDLDTGTLEITGRMYFTEDFDGEVRHEGGNYVRLQYHSDVGKWLITVITFDLWDGRGIGTVHGWDAYGWLDNIDPFGENYVAANQLKELGLLGTTGMGYGNMAWKEGSTWHVLACISAVAHPVDDPLSYDYLRPAYYTGPNLDNLTLQWRDDSATHVEAPVRCRMNGINYFHWNSNAYLPNAYPVYSSAGTLMGDLQDIAAYPDFTGIDSGEAWADWIPRARADGRTEFFAISNTKEALDYTLPKEAGGTLNMLASYYGDINRGSMTLWKAHQTTAGREFPVIRNGLKIQEVDTFTAPVASLKTNLKVALPLTSGPLDKSDYARNMKAVGTVTYGVNGSTPAAASGLYHKELGLININANYTASFVIKSTATIFDAVALNIGFRHHISIANNIVKFNVYDGSAWQRPAALSVLDGIAHHVLVRRLGNVFSIWFDGAKITEVTIATPDPGLGYFLVGAQDYSYTGYPMIPNLSVPVSNAGMSKVKAWTRALSDTEIGNDYNAGNPWMP